MLFFYGELERWKWCYKQCLSVDVVSKILIENDKYLEMTVNTELVFMCGCVLCRFGKRWIHWHFQRIELMYWVKNAFEWKFSRNDFFLSLFLSWYVFRTNKIDFVIEVNFNRKWKIEFLFLSFHQNFISLAFDYFPFLPSFCCLSIVKHATHIIQMQSKASFSLFAFVCYRYVWEWSEVKTEMKTREHNGSEEEKKKGNNSHLFCLISLRWRVNSMHRIIANVILLSSFYSKINC